MLDINNTNSKVIKIVDMLSRDVNMKSNQLLFYIHENGKVDKRIVIE